jgi:hypothetical protein
MTPDSRTSPTGAAGLRWPFLPAFIPFWYAGTGWWWWREIREQLESASSSAPSLGSTGMVSMALLARVMGALSEAGVYVLWWKGRGARLPYWRFMCWVTCLSTTDLLGFTLCRAAEESADLVRLICAVLAGPAALQPSPIADSGGVAAFGNLGVLTLLRVGMTGWAQARGTGRSLGGPLLLTAAGWLVSRLAGWWSFDLLSGLSPVR